jgi:cobalt-zinc-cadmium efflux system outer membrane protein
VKVGQLLRDNAALASWMRLRSNEFAASIARVRQADADASQSRVIPNPIIDASLSDIVLGQSNPPGLGFGETAIYSAGVTQIIELGKRGPRGRAADMRARSARLVSSSTLLERVALARLALGRVVYLTARQGILEEQLVSARAAAALEKVRLEQGAISGNDYDRLLLDTTTLEVDLARSRADFEGALAGCRGVLLASCDAPGANLTDLEESAQLPERFGAPGEVLERRADVRALDLERDAAREDAILAGRRAIPDPAIRVGYTHDNLIVSGDQENTLSFGLVLPLPIFDHGQHDSAKALARADEIESTRAATLHSAAADLEQLISRRDFLERELVTLQKDAVPRSQNVLSTTNKAFDQGQVSLTDLLMARRTHIALLLTVLDLKFDFFSVRSELRRVLGLDAPDIAQGTKP